ncbi:large ribosomal subunit protein uL23m isoform X4 [Mobula birostris]|uniref:large ribosomal subunit protein uL23m isoform X4 n=1 Tax=Mobula birostris TaxID=1983395 RepID=UPI003B2864D1
MARRVIYPLYQYGNPQLRIFRTNFFMTLVRPGKEQPENTVQFRIPMEMTKPDVKNYLQGIYNVPVAAVRTRIQFCTSKKRNHKNQRVKRPDYKVAYVQLIVEGNQRTGRKSTQSWEGCTSSLQTAVELKPDTEVFHLEDILG